jgi:hypothetical protein
LSCVVVGVGKEVDVHVEGNCLDTAFLLAFEGETSIETDPPNPSLYVAFALERVKAPPKVDECLLEKVVGFLLVFRKEVTHGEYRVFVPFDNVRKSLFFFSHVRVVCILDAKKGEILHREGYFFQKHKKATPWLFFGSECTAIASIFAIEQFKKRLIHRAISCAL